MEILVVGGAGFLGRKLVNLLLEEGRYGVFVVDVRPKPDSLAAEVNYVRGDIGNVEIGEQKRFDAIIHLAGARHEKSYEHLPSEISTTIAVMKKAEKTRAQKVIYVSSYYVYQGACNSEVVDEATPIDAQKLDVFACVKMTCERIVEHASKEAGLEYVVVRPGPLLGESADCPTAICQFIQQGIKGETITVFGKGERKMQYTLVDDVAAGIIHAMEKSSNEIFNLVCPERYSLREIAGILNEMYGFRFVFESDRAEGVQVPYILSEKAVRELGWRPTGLREALRTVYGRIISQRPEYPA